MAWRVRGQRFFAQPRTIGIEQINALLDAVKARAEEILRVSDAGEMCKAEVQERILYGVCRQYGARCGRIADIPAGKAKDALRYIRNWQGDSFLPDAWG